MAAANTDKFKKLTNNFSTTLSGAIVGASDTSMSLASTTNLNTDTGGVFVIDRVNSSGTATPTLREYVVGTVSGSNVTNLVRGVGNSTAQAHATGAVVEQVVDQRTINDIIDGILAQHNQDGTHGAVTATSVASSGTVSGTTGVFSSDVSDNSTTLKTIRSEYQFDFVASGCVWSGDAYASTRNASMTSGVVYIGGKRVSVSAVTARSFTASKDTYIDVDNTGTITYTEVTNNAASPALAANNLRLGIIVTGASNIASSGSVNQGQETMVLPIVSSVPYAVTDSLGNLICPRDANRKVLGCRQITSNFTTASLSQVAVTGLSVPVIVPTGRSIEISLYVPFSNNTTAGTPVNIYIWDGTVGSGTQIQQSTTANPNNVYCVAKTTPATTNKTYNIGMSVNGGTGSINVTSISPAQLIVRLV